jgi:putative flavoprotein involved in K+ transport
VNYRSKADFTGQRVIVVGGGNSGAQIAADLTLDGRVEVTWVTRRPPRYLPDDIDVPALFDVATARRRSLDAGRSDTGGVASLGDTSSPCRPSAPPATQNACWRGRCSPSSPSAAFGGPTAAGPARTRLSGAPVSARPCPTSPRWTCAARATASPPTAPAPWASRGCTYSATATGPASATLIGVGRTARDAVREVTGLLT